MKLLEKRVVVLSREKYQGSKLPDDFTLIEKFIPGVGYYGGALPELTNYQTLDELENIFKEIKPVVINKQFNNQTSIKALKWQDENISFSGSGPIIVNASYFPSWRSEDKNQKIYQVTPGQMLVFSSGKTNLKFSARLGEKISGWVSVIAIILLIFSKLFLWKKKK
jgi:uncharacterized membrane protein